MLLSVFYLPYFVTRSVASCLSMILSKVSELDMSIFFCIQVLMGQLWIVDETLGGNHTETKIDLMNFTPLTLYVSLLGYSKTALTFHTLAVKIPLILVFP